MADARVISGLERFLGERWGTSVVISDVRRMIGGAARTTWRCTAEVSGCRRGLVFRLAEGNDADLHLSGEHLEFKVMKAAFTAGLPVAEPLFLENDAQWLGGGFAILAEVPDCATDPGILPPPARAALAHDLWFILGRLTCLDPAMLDLDTVLEPAAPSNCARLQLDYWTAVFRESCVHPDPVGEAAIRWMAAAMPAPAQRLCLVHGDYRVGNLLFDGDGRVTAVLDWEMAHWGDPLEDLAWSLDPRQSVDLPDLAGGLAPYDVAIAAWQEASGLAIDPAALRWWQVFAAFKALAIWTKCASIYDTRTPKRPVLARIGWVLTERQQRVLADYLSPHSPRRLFEYRR